MNNRKEFKREFLHSTIDQMIFALGGIQPSTSEEEKEALGRIIRRTIKEKLEKMKFVTIDFENEFVETDGNPSTRVSFENLPNFEKDVLESLVALFIADDFLKRVGVR